MHEHDHPTAERAAGIDNHDQAPADPPRIPNEAPAAGPAAPPPSGHAGTPTNGQSHHQSMNGQGQGGWNPTAPVGAPPSPSSAVPPTDAAWGQPAANGYPQYHQSGVPGYGAPMYGPPPVQPPPYQQPQDNGRGQRGLIIALAGLIAALLLGAGVAVIMVVAGSDTPARADPAAATTAAPRAVTTVVRETTVHDKSTRSTARRTSRSRHTTSSSGRTITTSSSPTAARAEIKSMLQRHFANIRDGNYASAFADLGASLGQSQSSWISDISSDGLYSFSLSVAPQMTSSAGAIASILNFHTEADASGCKNWSGSWAVAKSGGRWLITKSNLSPTVVSCGE